MGPTQLEQEQQFEEHLSGRSSARGGATCCAAGAGVNISRVEKWGSLSGGTALLAAGLIRGRLSGLLLAGLGAALVHRGATGRSLLYEAVGIDTADHDPVTAVPAGRGYRTEKQITVQRPASALYYAWRDFENLPRIMRHLKNVDRVDDRFSRWTAEGPLGTTVQWVAEVINERENELIAWRSLDGSQIDTAGSIHFTPTEDGRGTLVRVNLKYDPPGGKLGAEFASWVGQNLDEQLDEDLKRFKVEMEAETEPQPSDFDQPKARG